MLYNCLNTQHTHYNLPRKSSPHHLSTIKLFTLGGHLKTHAMSIIVQAHMLPLTHSFLYYLNLSIVALNYYMVNAPGLMGP